MRVQVATEAAPGAAANEDAAFHRGDLVGVLDGVSAPAGVDTGCLHGPAWYVARLVHHLQAGTVPGVSLVDGLAAAIGGVRAEHGGRCDLDHPNTPAATVALARQTGDQLDYLVLCEAYLALDHGDRVQLVTDERFTNAVANIRREVLTGAAAIGTTQHDNQVRRAAHLRQQRTNQPGGYWIAAADPTAAHHAITGAVPLTGPDRVRRAVLLTDGASCAVDRFGLLDWRGLVDLVAAHGPAALIARVRAAEDADHTGREQPRYKRHDDASVALCTFGQE